MEAHIAVSPPLDVFKITNTALQSPPSPVSQSTKPTLKLLAYFCLCLALPSPLCKPMAGTRNPRTPNNQRKNLPAIPTDTEKDNAGRGSRKEREDMYIGGGDGYNRDAESSQPGLDDSEYARQKRMPTFKKDSSSPAGTGIPRPPTKDSNYASSTPTTRYTPHLTPATPTKHKSPRNKNKTLFTLPRLLKRPKPAPSSTRSDSTTNTLPKLPDLIRTSPIAQQLPSNFFPRGYTLDDDESSDAQTTPDLTMDDLYHLVLNMQKGFQELMLRRSQAGTAASVRSATREMDKYADTGRWFHNE
ncbi:255_t:CDS:2 [Paraglomus brasilianum]|uniref:255_t:CDS:1 n=1 Tax=Paraglomus brasilianum TaxID=144538 RepID=A0A9N9ALQ4_9GLOM|nr:255_t:CDS:2 [Paraglomus brasilianum]